jgi:hypothetical protein
MTTMLTVDFQEGVQDRMAAGSLVLEVGIEVKRWKKGLDRKDGTKGWKEKTEERGG